MIDLYLQVLPPDVLVGESDGIPVYDIDFAHMKAGLKSCGIDIDGWDIRNQEFFASPNFFAKRVDKIPTAFDPDGLPVAFVPGVNINIRWYSDVAPDLTSYEGFVFSHSPESPHTVFI